MRVIGNFVLVGAPVAPLMVAPGEQSVLADEALHGMKAEILGEAPGGWVRVRMYYGYEGYARREDLVTDGGLVAAWERLDKMAVTKSLADVLSAPSIRGRRLAGLPRGAVVAVIASPNAEGWVRAALCDGREGFMKTGHLGAYVTSWSAADEPGLRRRLIDTALSYLGTQYRWGGKTPQGIDCSGLCSMAYLMNGVVIYRDADIREGYCMRRISLEEAGEGDLIFFKGHVAMHLGGGRIVHATARNGSDGVVLNSLNPQDGDYRPDLIPILRFAGAIF